jgi:exopolysaccharide biosynthesis polyprenyl glycosylphosphotransferase
MFRRFSINFALLSIAIDSLLVCLILAIASHLRPGLGFLPFAADYPHFIALPWIIYPIFAVEWIAAMSLFSVYDGRRNIRWLDEFTSLTLGTLLAAMVMAGTLYISFREVSRLLFASFVILTYLSTLMWRAALRWGRKIGSLRLGHLRRVLIIGAGEVGLDLREQIQANPELGLAVIGFLDSQYHSPDRTVYPILGSLEQLQSVIKEYYPDDVVISLPQQEYEQTKVIIAKLHNLPVKVWLIPDYFRLALHKAAVEEFAGIPMLDLRAPALSDQQRLIKRAFDLTITIISLPFALLAMGFIALAIRIEGSGPIILEQERMGENGRLFKMYKFRTMQPGAEDIEWFSDQTEEMGKIIHKRSNDPRVTRVGRILRRTSLDEILQLFNVLKGEMSLVGPRPELPYLVDQYETWQRQRFAAPQGMTGWWQINGRSDRPMHLHTEDDLYYIQHYSLLLDIYIIIKTVGVVLQGKGAF